MVAAQRWFCSAVCVSRGDCRKSYGVVGAAVVVTVGVVTSEAVPDATDFRV